MDGTTAIRSTTQAQECVCPTPAAKPTGPTEAAPRLTADQTVLRAQGRGLAAATVPLNRWQQLDFPEKFFVGLTGTGMAVTTTALAVEGARLAKGFGPRLAGGAKGAALGLAAGVVAMGIFDLMFAYGTATRGYAKLLEPKH